jgi:hypothetical protein
MMKDGGVCHSERSEESLRERSCLESEQTLALGDPSLRSE